MKEKVEAYLKEHRQEYLEDLAGLVAVDSSRGQEEPGKPYGKGPAEALKMVLQLAEKFGLYTENWGNYVGIVQIRPGETRALDIIAHLDVVPGGDGWTVTSPFIMKAWKGRLYGRGVIDDKGPALSAIYALRAIKALDIELKENVRVVLGCDEECGSSDLKYYFSKTDAAPMTFSPDGDFPVVNTEKGIYYGYFAAKLAVSETERLPRLLAVNSGVKGNIVPGRGQIVVEGLSLLELEPLLKSESEDTGVTFTARAGEDGRIVIDAEGLGGHASTPELCNNALTAMLRVIRKLPLPESEGRNLLLSLSRLFPHGDFNGKAAGIFMEDAVSGPITVSLNLLRFDGQTLHATFDSRIPLCANKENLKPMRIQAEAAGFSFTDKLSEAHHVPEDSYFVQRLLRHYEDYFNRPGKCLSTGGATYVHGIKNGVAFGCMEQDVDYHIHNGDEFITEELLFISANLFAAVVMDLCNM